MRISAKLNEVNKTEILLHTADPYSVGRILKNCKEQIEKVEVIRCRKSPCPPGRKLESWENYMALNQHKVNIFFKSNAIPIKLKITSWRLDAASIEALGLTPDPLATSKEKTAKVLLGLEGNNEYMC